VHGYGYPVPLQPDIQHSPGWGGGVQPRKEGVRGAAPGSFFFEDFCKRLETISWSSKTKLKGEKERKRDVGKKERGTDAIRNSVPDFSKDLCVCVLL